MRGPAALADPRPVPYRGAPAGPPFTVAEDRLDLWLLDHPLDGTAGPLDRSELDEAETGRADSFLRPADGLLYAAAHIALRRLLGRYTGIPPREVRFLREACPNCGAEHGRPAVAAPLHFSLSHSDGAALVGVAAVPVGVDVERLPRERTIEVCAPALHPREGAELADVHGADRQALFGRIWTRKEAYLKGLGVGLSRSPAQDYLGADRTGHPAGWTVLDIPCGTTHAAAAAVRGPAPARVEVRRLGADWLHAPAARRPTTPAPRPPAGTTPGRRPVAPRPEATPTRTSTTAPAAPTRAASAGPMTERR